MLVTLYRFHSYLPPQDEIEFIVTDKTDANGEIYPLTFIEHDNGKVQIAFSGYEFTCRYYSDYQTSCPEGNHSNTVSETFSDSGSEAIPFQFVEEKPSFMGGDANNFSRWVNEKLVYPEPAKENGVSGRVTLQFTVNEDGSISNVKVINGVDPALDKEAVRVVSMSPKWTPGKQRDRAVKVIYTFPVIFQLR